LKQRKLDIDKEHKKNSEVRCWYRDYKKLTNSYIDLWRY